MQNTYLRQGIEYRNNTPYQPQENSIAERINQTLMNAARAALHHANLDDTFWEDSVRDAAFKYNIMLHTSHGKSPYEVWHGSVPTSKHLFTFGQLGTATIHSPKRKLQPRADPARDMYGISRDLIMVFNLRTNRYQQLRHSDFRQYNHEQDPTYQQTQARRASNNPHFPTIPSSITATTPEPKSHNMARRYPDADLWSIAHDKELDNLDTSGTMLWIPDEKLPPNERLIPLKMAYKYKRDENGRILSRKARCAVRGDTMKPGLPYDPARTTTYMAETPSIRILLAIAADKNGLLNILTSRQHTSMNNIPTTDRSTYVRQHPRFNGNYRHPNRAGQLIGNLYGTPPASHIYFQALADHLKRSGFTQTEADPCLFFKCTDSSLILIAVSMDDFLVVANNTVLITEAYKSLQAKYQIKRLGFPSNYLNWKITPNTDGSINIAQPHVVRAILSKTNMSSCNPKPSPSTEKINRDLEINSPPLATEDAQQFRSIVGDLRYLADSTRFDIYHITNRLAAAMHQPSNYHEQLLKCLLRYLRGTVNHGITYQTSQTNTSHNVLQTFSDADFANSRNRKSYTGIVHTVHGSPISWTSNQQPTVALSTCEAEYLSATTATQETNWLRRLLHELDHTQSQPTCHHIDNNSAILVAKNTAPTKRRKLIDVRYHYLRDHIVNIVRIASTDNPADLFTKPVGKTLFHKYARSLNLLPPQKDSSVAPGTD